jgi:inhibitor of cysteine peptidase
MGYPIPRSTSPAGSLLIRATNLTFGDRDFYRSFIRSMGFRIFIASLFCTTAWATTPGMSFAMPLVIFSSSVSRANSTEVETIQMTRRTYDESVNGQTIDLAIGQTIEIRLRENPTTGYRWQLMGGDRAVCAMTSDTFKPASGPPGRGGKHSWIFEAVGPGECDIGFRYRRPWGDPEQSERMFQIHIRVENPQRSVQPGH